MFDSNLNSCYAHSTSQGIDTWELLPSHLHLVSKLAAQFASKFGASAFGEVLGKWHDIGKYSQEFQAYLKSQNGIDVHNSEVTGRVDHSTAGAQHAVTQNLHRPIRNALAYCIAGHHAGLANSIEGIRTTSFNSRMEKKVPEWQKFADTSFLGHQELLLPPQIDASVRQAWKGESGESRARSEQRAGFTWGMFVRMLFSALVDADFLATEQFMSPSESQARPKYAFGFDVLSRCLQQHMERLQKANCGRLSTIRSEILTACNSAAAQSPGLFSLTVPTGGGKTLAAMSFALRHILANPENHFDRVIVAIPFTSIIEQTVDVYRTVFSELSEDLVLEHHSNIEPDKETKHSRLASQNFDAPIVVTTNIQLFESLFANRTSRCRKLHNIARSVIIFDEAQTLPVELLEPTLLAIQELVANYGCTVVLCTATQPAIKHSGEFPIGLRNVREIIPNPYSLYQEMRRTRVQHIGQQSLDSLVTRLVEHDQFLCIHNTRPLAAETYRLVRQIATSTEGLFHLSTNMCPNHRRNVLRKIRERLKNGDRCQVVSTQLIEAGVDVDFPVVYRSIAGLDSIAQAAGRCNREGARESGNVFVFSLPELPPPGFLRATAATTQTLIEKFSEDLIHPDAIELYFKVHYWQNQTLWDRKGILPMHSQGLRHGLVDFESVAQAFRMIEDQSTPILVPYDKQAIRYIKRLRASTPDSHPLSRRDRQEISRRSVPVFTSIVEQLLGREFEYVYDGQYAVLINDTLYDDDIGLNLKKVGVIDSGDLVI